MHLALVTILVVVPHLHRAHRHGLRRSCCSVDTLHQDAAQRKLCLLRGAKNQAQNKYKLKNKNEGQKHNTLDQRG
jgi:hypothetical protein